MAEGDGHIPRSLPIVVRPCWSVGCCGQVVVGVEEER
jgi:hypothetical protein